MGKFIGYLIGGLMMLLVGIFGTQSAKDSRADAMERFHITAVEAPLFKACTSTMSYHEIGFKSGVSTMAGCACTARELTDNIRASQMDSTRAIMKRMLKEAGTDSTNFSLAADLMAIKREHNLDNRSSIRLIEKVNETMSYCSDPRTHWTDEQSTLAKANDMELRSKTHVNNRTPRQVIEDKVLNSEMSRAAADKRLNALHSF